MVLGLLSDTHGYFHPALTDVLAGVDLIVHAGDVGSTDVLERLKELAPVRAVWGNVDGPDVRRLLTEHERFTLEGIDVWVTHIAGRPGRWQRGMGTLLEQDPPDVFICGHSHILRVERVQSLGGMLFVNPGAAGRQGMHHVKTCVRLAVEEGTLQRAEVVHLDEER